MGTFVTSYSLTPLQEGMLFHALQANNIGVDVEQMVARLEHRIDIDLFRAAWQRITDRHDVLRTRFRWADVDDPIQEVLDAVDVDLTLVDHTTTPQSERRTAIDTFLATDRAAMIDLGRAPMWRVTLFHFTDDLYEMVFTYHHSLLDTSVVWVLQEVFDAYDATVRGDVAELDERLPYRDHVEWLNAHRIENRAASRAYYRDLLKGHDDPISLEALAVDADTADGSEPVRYEHDRFAISADLSAALRAAADQGGWGLAATIEATWGTVLGAFSGSTDVVFGATRAGRRSGLPGSDQSIGLFINTPPVRIRFDPTQTVSELIATVRRQQIDKRSHEHTALVDIQADVASSRSLFESIVVVNDRHQGTRLKELGGEYIHRSFDLHDQTDTPLNLLAFLDDTLHFKLSYDPRRFAHHHMVRVREQFLSVLEFFADHPDSPCADIPLVPSVDAERIAEWNDTFVPIPGEATIPKLFERQVDRTPDAPAVTCRGESLTYAELDARANAVAHRLHSLGVGPDTMVGILMHRSIDMMIALLGTLKAGGAYVPMDPEYPAERLAMMLEDAGTDVVITDPESVAVVNKSAPNVMTLETLVSGTTADETVRPTASSLQPAHLAYVIFTSGSTGRPKGVQIEHRNVVNFFTAMDVALGHTDGDEPGVWLAVTSISFDISVLELFWTLTRGFSVIIQNEDSRIETVSRPATGPTDSTSDRLGFSLFYFAADAAASPGDRYRLLLDGARFADTHGFSAVWTPERHFHGFGGNYPNPAVTSAALAMVTERLQLRAGSVVLPLHNPIRCAEDWAVVDNLSNGRVGLSFASGWHANDFVLAPDNYEDRRALMATGIETIRSLWRGESVTARGGDGRDVSVSLFPEPIQAEPPIWVTASGSPETFENAGRIGASILTNLLVMSEVDLTANIERYRAAFAEAGHAGTGHVSLMLHTFVGEQIDDVYATVREPFLEYLKTSTNLIDNMQWEDTSFAKPNEATSTTDSAAQLSSLSEADVEVLMEHAFQRYVRSAGLFGTPTSCLATIERLAALGVDEFACLIDFGIDDDTVLDNLPHLDALRVLANQSGTPESAAPQDATADAVAAPVSSRSYGLLDHLTDSGVTHLQCTPSHASVIASSPDGQRALLGLRQLLLGGEALPVVLSDRLRSQLPGEMYNMYGPTETTIWSTVAPILTAGADITIGRPIANTTIQIVDDSLRPLPIGVAGELLIGGLGVVRGYLDRPELTAERFVELGADGGNRYYRTGDLARWTSDGRLEFLGRLDHQVKIRGHRIELGEVEAAIARADDIEECVVVDRAGADGDPQLVAFVVPRRDQSAAPRPARTTDVDWGEIWDLAYDPANTTGNRADATFDLAGWSDSYSGEMIPDHEMADWVDHTVSRIRQLDPQHVLEVGCGTGLLLFRIAPQCARYVGVDLAQHALDQIGRTVGELSIDNVELVRTAADQIAVDAAGTYDTIIVNSVAQYFPDADYLVGVIRSAMSMLEPGGSIFLGDLRHRGLGRAFATEIELEGATASTGLDELSALVDDRVARDSELLIDPALFDALPSALPDISRIDVQLKTSPYDNEMSRYRYDVVITSGRPLILDGEGHADEPCEPEADVSNVDSILDGVRRAAESLRSPIVVRGIQNARLARPVAAAARLTATDSGAQTAGDLRAALDESNPGIAPAELTAGVDGIDGYESALRWSSAGLDCLDLELYAEGQPPTGLRITHGLSAPSTIESWDDFSNRHPASTSQRKADDVSPDLVPRLRSELRKVLPEYMIPTAFMELDDLPRTPNGKIDRSALPELSSDRVESASTVIAADTDLEREISEVWKALLGLADVGAETNVFDLGANSLLMVKASSQISSRLGLKVTLVQMFAHPTIRSLATALDARSGSNDDRAVEAPDSVQSDAVAPGATRADKRRAARSRNAAAR